MKKKRPRRKAQKPPPSGGRRGPRSPGAGRAPAIRRPEVQLQYKVVELSTVDEGSLERTLNEWVPKGWTLENVQFAMRESSKRPAMAFVFFTREAEVAAVDEHDEAAARERLARLAQGALLSEEAQVAPPAAVSPRERLAQLAGLSEDDEPPSAGLEWKVLEPDE